MRRLLPLLAIAASCAPSARPLAGLPGEEALAIAATVFEHRELRLSGAAPRTLAVGLPERASLPLHLALHDDASFFASITALDVNDVVVEIVQKTRVFRGAARATDLVHLSDETRVEELRLLHEGASGELRWSLHAGPAVARVRLREGRVELLDASSVVRLSSAPMFALDAHGRRRELAVSLVASGTDFILTAALDVSGLAHPITVDPAWSTVPAMSRARSELTLTVLPSGSVLAAGGTDSTTDSSALSSAEVYDPTANTWSAVGSMAVARRGHTATALADGRVVILGGHNSGSLGVLAAEVYSAGSFSAFGSLSAGHSGHTATLLGGKILVSAGGVNSAELFDPVSQTSTAAGALNERKGASAFLLASGKVLVAGGLGSVVRGAELYDPTTNAWTAAGSMISPRFGQSGVLLPSGKVLIDGGRGASETLTLEPELYDPVGNSWSTVTPRGAERRDAVALMMSFGKALFTGGNALPTAPSAELFDPTTGAWVNAGAMLTTRHRHGAVRLSDGRVLVAGGNNATDTVVLASAEVFAIQPLGAVCTLGGECASGNCIDGVCCNTTCTGQCEACDVAATKGTCTPVAGAPHGTRSACSTGAGDPCKAQLCDAVDRVACRYPPAGGPACSSAACVDGIETHPSTCNGKGACADVPTSCGGYACGVLVCKKTCATVADCAPGARCTGMECVTLPGLGESCTGPSTCNAGLFCVDGVCCGVAACSAGSSCSAGPMKGVCAKINGSSCTAATQCGSGFCVDGVCCDGLCDAQCEACDVPNAAGKKGACLPVKGAPHMGRASCSSDASNVCASGTCDGATRAKCAGLVADETSCRPQSCKNGTVTLGGVCDGKGSCPMAITSPCSGFRCDDAGQSCRTACATAAECIEGFDCVDKVCKRRTASCSVDGKQRLDATTGAPTECAPYVCVAGACRVECATSNDCQGGTVCQDKACITPTAGDAGDEGSGCAMGRPSGSTSVASVLALALLLRLRGRRRRSPRAPGHIRT